VLKGTKLAAQAQGKLKVESKAGYLELDLARLRLEHTEVTTQLSSSSTKMIRRRAGSPGT
jgi:hypothetical protein